MLWRDRLCISLVELFVYLLVDTEGEGLIVRCDEMDVYIHATSTLGGIYTYTPMIKNSTDEILSGINLHNNTAE